MFGQRFLGLIDNQGIYNTYRVPRPEAPYPQDYVIDQQGYVRYWSDEYDPQEIIRIIDRLLATEVKEQKSELFLPGKINLDIAPNPFSEVTKIKFQAPNSKNQVTMSIYDVTGRLVKDFSLSTPYALHPTLFEWSGTDQRGRSVPAGVYFVRLEVAGDKETKTIVLTK